MFHTESDGLGSSLSGAGCVADDLVLVVLPMMILEHVQIVFWCISKKILSKLQSSFEGWTGFSSFGVGAWTRNFLSGLFLVAGAPHISGRRKNGQTPPYKMEHKNMAHMWKAKA